MISTTVRLPRHCISLIPFQNGEECNFSPFPDIFHLREYDLEGKKVPRGGSTIAFELQDDPEFEGCSIIRAGISRCHPVDVFVKNVGRSNATERYLSSPMFFRIPVAYDGTNQMHPIIRFHVMKMILAASSMPVDMEPGNHSLFCELYVEPPFNREEADSSEDPFEGVDSETQPL